MRPSESTLFPATAIPAGLACLGVTVWLSWERAPQLWPSATPLLVMSLFALASHILSFSATGSERVSLELAYFIAAALALPFPAPLIVATFSSLAGSFFRMQPGLSRSRFVTLTGANVAISTTMAASAAGAATLLSPIVAPIESAILRTLLLAAALFFAMNAVNLIAVAAWVAARRESPWAWARRFLSRILPGEAVTVPFGCLLVFVLDAPSRWVAFMVLGSIGLFLSFLLKTLSDSDERLRRTNHELEDRLAELATLNAIGREISSSLDPVRVFKIVRRECRKVFRPDLFFIARVDYETREIHVEHSMASDVPSRTTKFLLGQGLTSFVITSEKPFLVGDAPRDPRLKGLRPIIVEPKIRSVLAVPLIVENRVIGVLSVQCYRENAYEERHVALLTTIGQQAAVALENARNYQMATVDHLTALYQRDYFFQRLGDEHRRAARYGTTFSILMLDLDSFKRINDRFGHFAGDRFLKSVGTTIRSILRGADVPCRYGGEEFCILLPETDLAGARTIAERIRSEIGALRIEEGTHALSTTVSIGVSSYPVHFEGNLTGLLQKADRALYTAKKEGKDRVISAAA